MAQKVAEQVVDMLVDTGVKRIYAVTGDSLNEINDAVRRNEKIDWIHVRHEETGAFAAGAEAQITGNIACCAGSSGPGHVHLINGIYDAHRSHRPHGRYDVLLFPEGQEAAAGASGVPHEPRSGH